VPAAIGVTVLPDTVQTPAELEVKLTGKVELALAVNVNWVPTVPLAGPAKLMIWFCWTSKVWVTG
jgi:hypothetical protein